MERAELLKIRLQLLKRELGETHLVAVSKSTDSESIRYAFEVGQVDFGENRVESLEDKSNDLEDLDLNWHFIGKLQSNKINRLFKIPKLKYIHSVDSLKLLEHLYKRVDQITSERVGFFLQVNTSEETEKSGFCIKNYDELAAAANLISQHLDSKFYLLGLMTMGKYRTTNFEEDARLCFKRLDIVRNTLKRDFELPPLKLSMGMSQDYSIAIEEGSDFVRIGTSIFKPEEPRD
ncbi:MAG: pyridoxal phosphate enzyme (YggS family) [Bacteriovoracaceae bacterium]|jgi:pyridoxal phosphate enzyme (YggS family)